MDFAAEIEQKVHTLRVERDTWRAIALQYKAAFEAQNDRLMQLQDICFAAQAELENERAQQQRLHTLSDQELRSDMGGIDGAAELKQEHSFGTASIQISRKQRRARQRKSSEDSINPLFDNVQHYVDQHNYSSALVEIDRLLRGPLSSKARAEGLLLKSSVLQAADPSELYDALAACSEALEFCDRLSELETLLPRVQYQRGILYYELRMLDKAREIFSTLSNHDVFSVKAAEYCKICDNGLRVTKRRSGFDEHRTINEDLLTELVGKTDVCDSRQMRFPYMLISVS